MLNYSKGYQYLSFLEIGGKMENYYRLGAHLSVVTLSSVGHAHAHAPTHATRTCACINWVTYDVRMECAPLGLRMTRAHHAHI